MSTSEAITLDQVVDTARYPLAELDSAEGQAVIVPCPARTLRPLGCTVLPDFIRPSLREALEQECAALAPQAHFDVETVNVYNIAVDPDAARGPPGPPDLPARQRLRRPRPHPRRLPHQPALLPPGVPATSSPAASGCRELHELADPLSGLVLNVVEPGMEHPWHFDTNEFTVSMLTRQAAGRRRLRVLPEHPVRRRTSTSTTSATSWTAGASG